MAAPWAHLLYNIAVATRRPATGKQLKIIQNQGRADEEEPATVPHYFLTTFHGTAGNSDAVSQAARWKTGKHPSAEMAAGPWLSP